MKTLLTTTAAIAISATASFAGVCTNEDRGVTLNPTELSAHKICILKNFRADEQAGTIGSIFFVKVGDDYVSFPVNDLRIHGFSEETRQNYVMSKVGAYVNDVVIANALTESVDNSVAQAMVLEAALTEAKEAHMKAMMELTTAHASEIAEKVQEIATHAAKIAEVEAELSDVKATLATAQATIADQTATIEAKVSTISELNGEVADLKGEVANLFVNLEDATATIAMKQGQIDVLADIRSTLEGQIETLESEAEANADAIEMLETTKSNLQDQINDLNDDKVALQETIDSMFTEAQLNAAKAEANLAGYTAGVESVDWTVGDDKADISFDLVVDGVVQEDNFDSMIEFVVNVAQGEIVANPEDWDLEAGGSYQAGYDQGLLDATPSEEEIEYWTQTAVQAFKDGIIVPPSVEYGASKDVASVKSGEFTLTSSYNFGGVVEDFDFNGTIDFANATFVLESGSSFNLVDLTATELSSLIEDAIETSYDRGYDDGYNDGYTNGFADGVASVKN